MVQQFCTLTQKPLIFGGLFVFLGTKYTLSKLYLFSDLLLLNLYLYENAVKDYFF